MTRQLAAFDGQFDAESVNVDALRQSFEMLYFNGITRSDFDRLSTAFFADLEQKSSEEWSA